MIENHTTFYGFYWRYGDFNRCGVFLSKMLPGMPWHVIKMGQAWLCVKIKARWVWSSFQWQNITAE